MNVFREFAKVEDVETQKEVLNATVLQDSTHQLTRQNALITMNVVRLECVQMENAPIWMEHSDANVRQDSLYPPRVFLVLMLTNALRTL